MSSSPKFFFPSSKLFPPEDPSGFPGVEPEERRGDPVFALQDHRAWEPVTANGQSPEFFGAQEID